MAEQFTPHYQPAPDRYQRMEYRRCGRSGLMLPAISLGLWHNFGEDTPHATKRAIVRTAIDAGMAARAAETAARLQSDQFWPGARQGLTQRESEILSLVVTGLSNRGIAAKLVIGDETVKTHLSSIYRKLGVGDRTSAAALALREGIFR